MLPYLEKIGFHIVGYGCTTCIGNSGPLPERWSTAIQEGDLVAAAVLSGNRNFEGRIHANVRANYLASPPLVVAYALAGSMNVDLYNDPLGNDPQGKPVYLKDIWPSPQEVNETMRKSVRSEMFKKEYSQATEGDAQWKKMPVPRGELFQVGPAVDLRARGALLRRHDEDARRILNRSPARACWRCSAIP